MKIIYNLSVLLILLFSYNIVCAQHVREPRVYIEDYKGTEAGALKKIDSVEALIVTAESQGISTEQEKMTISLAKTFLLYANWDEENTPVYTEMFDGLHEFFQTTPENLAQHLPTYERSEVITMLTESITTLEALLSGEISRQPSPIIDWRKISYDTNRLVYNEKPVFLADYTWQPKKAGVISLEDYFGAYDGFYFDPTAVVSEQGAIADQLKKYLKQKPSGNFGTTFIGHKNIPSWLESKFPKVDIGKALYTGYDISNPASREIIQKLFSGIVPLIKGKNYTKQGYMLTNEPHWNLTGNWEIVQFSDYAKDSLRVWLKKKHRNIEAFNTLWGKDYSSFDEIDIESFPMEDGERGKPIGYDIIKFNQDRVTNWFTFLDSEVKKYDSGAMTHIKLIPMHWSQNGRGNGLDFEALTRLTSNIGNDAGAKKSFRWGGPYDWTKRYAYFWRDMAMTYDFFRSVSPKKVNYNSEGHFLQSTAFTDLFLEPSYVRSIYWLAVLQGMNSVQSWFWPRENNGSLQNKGEDIAASLINQPRVVNEISKTFMDLNTHSEDIDALQHLEQPIRLFYSETSAINKLQYMDGIFKSYEELYFEGLSIGFATKDILEKNDNRTWEVVLIKNTEYVTTEELNALQSYLDNGGTIIMDTLSLKKNEYDVLHRQNLVQGKGSLRVMDTPENMNRTAMHKISSQNKLPPLTLNEHNTGNKKRCVWRSYKDEDERYVINVLNIGNKTSQVTVGIRGVSNDVKCVNLLNGEKMNPTFSINPEEVLLLEITKNTN
ncbi:beta-galactosidase [Zobellia roscoffensis]|uniref:beta-galactosidase n=1 Tax=Zobellia roscoffensis TaxID=2779508 RepID=UPI00188A28B3|nr:beta-galactosidase [Zobellia roscoffensis]